MKWKVSIELQLCISHFTYEIWIQRSKGTHLDFLWFYLHCIAHTHIISWIHTGYSAMPKTKEAMSWNFKLPLPSKSLGLFGMNQLFSTGVILPPRRHLAMSEDIFGYYNWDNVIGSYWVEPESAAKYPIMNRTPSPSLPTLLPTHNKEYLGKNVNSAETAEYWCLSASQCLS